MGQNQFPISIDKTYKPLLDEIAKQDPTYLNQTSHKPCYKKICEEGIKMIHEIKTNKINIRTLLFCDNCKAKNNI